MDKCILVHHLSSINSVIAETFKSTQRIKLTCFDVSEEYIVFGASSGGIYIFKREPCEFLKIIPSKEGSAIKIVIAPKRTCIAIASSKGLVIILEDFLDINIRPLIHNEHEGSIVRAIKWHGNSIYSGDDAGRIAVFSFSNLLTIFQTASATIMRLDSNIVQIDACLNYLLISTKTRTVLCDTEKECYKQIGKKSRDGNFGACFFSIASNELPEAHPSIKGIFKTIKENESFMTSLSNSDIKIYCARPGARLWEANFEATVVVTHQFRDTLNQSPSDLVHLKDVPDAKLSISNFKGVNEVLKNFNFGIIHPILCRFIFSYDGEGIYFFDPIFSKLAFWSNRFKGVKQIVILGSTIYIWQDNLQIDIISLERLEEVILKTLFNKQYYFCADLCATYYDDVISLIDHSQKIHLISILKSKLVELDATELLEKVMPLLQVLEKFNKKQALGKKLSNGIVVIENPHSEVLDYDNIYIPESVQNFKNTTEDASLKEDIHDKIQPQKKSTEENVNLLALYKQFKLNETHKNAELTESAELMKNLSLENLLILFQDFIKYLKTTENSDPSLWCKEQFMKQAANRDFDLKTTEQSTLLYLQNCFLELCNMETMSCMCGFPLPCAHKKPPEYYILGCKLLQDLRNMGLFLLKVPYTHKYILSQLNKLNDALFNLPLIVQFNDQELYEHFVTIFTYDAWDEVLKLYIKLRKGKCLNCEEDIETESICPWSNLGMLMIKSIGPQNTTRLLKRYSQNIPSDSLDAKFYQCCILSSTLEQPGSAVNFMDKIVTENVASKFEDQMVKYLQNKYQGCQSQPGKQSNTTQKCSYCDIPFQGPILSDSKKCDGGHQFHSLCFAHINGICNICSKT